MDAYLLSATKMHPFNRFCRVEFVGDHCQHNRGTVDAGDDQHDENGDAWRTGILYDI